MYSEIKDIPFRTLESLWEPLLHKFACWNITGVEYNDLLQEMRVVLWRVQQKYSSLSKASFKTYLYRACLNKMFTIHRDNHRKRRNPGELVMSLEGRKIEEGLFAPDLLDDVETYSMLSNSSKETKLLAFSILNDMSFEEYLTSEQIEIGIKELKELLKGE